MSLRSTVLFVMALGLSFATAGAQSTENFDGGLSLPTGWSDGGGTFTWTIDCCGTSSSNTGPSADHTTGSTGNYAYCETSQGSAGSTYILNCRPFTSAGGNVDFWYHMFGATMGTLEFQEKVGGMWTTTWMLSGDQGNAWTMASVPLMTTGAGIEVRWMYTRGTSFTGDATIDDVTVPGTFDPLPYQGNTSTASANIDGVLTDGLNPAVVSKGFNVDGITGAILTTADGIFNLSTDSIGGFWEVIFNNVPLNAPGINLGPDALVNLDLAGGFNGLNGGPLTVGLLPVPGGALPGVNSVSFNVPFSLSAPLTLSLQAIVTDPGAPAGFRLSQGSQLDVVANTIFPAYSVCPSTIGNDLPGLTDDGSINFVPSSAFTFYGVAYSDFFINMNGNITFGTGDTDFTPTEGELLSDQPRIAPCWDDWTPSDVAQGTVRTFDDGMFVAVEWFDVRHFGTADCGGLVDSNTFCATLVLSTGDMLFDFGIMQLCNGGTAPSVDQIVGICPGSSLSLPMNVDLWDPIGGVANNNPAAGANDAIYEDFSQGVFGFFDLSGPNTAPGNTLIFTGNGAGAGPYTQN